VQVSKEPIIYLYNKVQIQPNDLVYPKI